MSWRERYKNNEARFDHHIKTFQYKNKLSRRPVPVGFDAMFMDGMEDLDDFGTDDEEEEDRRPQVKRAARVDSDSDDGIEEPTRARPVLVNKVAVAPKQPVSKRKRVSDTNDRTPKRSKVAGRSGSGEPQDGNTNEIAEGKEDDVMDQDSQGEETFEVEQNLFCPSDEDSMTAPRLVLLFVYLSGGSIHVPIDHVANPKELAHQNESLNPLRPVAQWHPLPRTASPDPVNRCTDLTAPKTLPRALSQQLTLMIPRQSPQ